MTVSLVRDHLLAHGWAGDILEFDESSATVELAAAKVGTQPARIAKTLAFYDHELPGQALLVVVAGDVKVNGGAFKRAFGAKPKMLQATDVLPLTNHPVGGVCPFALPLTTKVFLDVSLKRFDTVFPAAGTTNSAVEVTVHDLPHLSNALRWVDITSTSTPQQ